MERLLLLVLVVIISASGANALTEQQCWDRWYAEELAQQAKPEDAINPRNGKPLSQTEGAKRSRQKKLQALEDALTLRGRDDPRWKAYLAKCE
jgi:hypothetical protein